MPHWLLKAALQRGISWLPRRQMWNELFQRHVTHSLDLSAERFESRLEYCRWHWERFRELRPDRARSFNALEVGTGWYPVVPLGLYLHGANAVWTLDIDPFVNAERLAAVFTMLEDYAANGRLRELLPELLPGRLKSLRAACAADLSGDPGKALEPFGIQLRVQDASHTGLPANAVDLMVSTSVLEYIPPAVLAAILAEFRRVATPGAVMTHNLNLMDQYSYFDRSISPLNFLRFPTARWKYLNSPFTWLNRLRISDYRELFHAAGFKTTREENTRGTAADLARVPLAPEFQKYSQDDLLVLASRVTAQLVNPG